MNLYEINKWNWFLQCTSILAIIENIIYIKYLNWMNRYCQNKLSMEIFDISK